MLTDQILTAPDIEKVLRFSAFVVYHASPPTMFDKDKS
jgi:hypothetical protein